MPTAVLSNHTGGFGGFTFKDLTDEVMPIVNRWKAERIKFDGIYSGYLGSERQVDILIKAIDELKSDNTLIVVDPVMGDNGLLYKAFSPDFPVIIKQLCAKADVITPNITEACLMLGAEYKKPPFTKEYIENLIGGLKKICDKNIVLTGVSFENNTLGAAAYNSKSGETFYYFGEKINGMHHGTGDVFTSVLTSSLVLGNSIEKATASAVDFTLISIKNTADYPELWYGVNFEGVLTKLPQIIGGSIYE